jgi:hypothetical protein
MDVDDKLTGRFTDRAVTVDNCFGGLKKIAKHKFCRHSDRREMSLQTLMEFKAMFSCMGARGSVVVKALCCKPEGRGFKSG